MTLIIGARFSSRKLVDGREQKRKKAHSLLRSESKITINQKWRLCIFGSQSHTICTRINRINRVNISVKKTVSSIILQTECMEKKKKCWTWLFFVNNNIIHTLLESNLSVLTTIAFERKPTIDCTETDLRIYANYYL